MGIPIRLARQWPFAAAVCLALVVLVPSLTIGYVNDDILNSTLPGYWKALRVDPIRDTWHQVKNWLFHHGRFNPLMHAWKNAWFYLVRDLMAHKVLILAMVGVDLWLLYRLCRALAQPRAAAAFACLLAALLIQFRAANDPVLAFNGMMQLVVGLALGSLLALCKYRSTGRLRWLAASLLLHLAGCLTYECCVLLCVAHAALLVGDGRGRVWLRAAPFIATGGLVVLVNLGVRAKVTLPPNDLYAMVLDQEAVLSTFQRQCLAAAPLSYGMYDPNKVFSQVSFHRECLNQAWVALLVLPLACLMAHRLPASRPSPFLLLFGAGLVVLPAVPIAVCFRYQNELRDGLGHLPVYLQTFGAAVLVTSAAGWAARGLAAVPWARRSLAVALGLACTVIATGHRASNAAVLRHHLPESRWRSQLEDLYRAGLLDPIPKGVVLVSDINAWDFDVHGKAFVLQNARKRLDVRLNLVEARQVSGAWRLIRFNGPSDDGVVALGALGAPSRSIMDVRVHRVAVRTHTLDGRPLPPREFSLRGVGPEAAALPSSSLKPIFRTHHWVVYELPTPFWVCEAATWVEFARHAPR